MDEIVFSDRMDKFVSRPYSPLHCSLIFRGLHDRNTWRAFGELEFTVNDLLVLDGVWYYPEYYTVGFARKMNEHAQASPEYSRSLIDSTKRYGSKLEKTSDRIRGTDYSGATKAQLHSDFTDYATAFAEYMPALGIFSLTSALEDYLQAVLRKSCDNPSDADEHWAAITLSAKQNYYKLERRALLHIALLFKRDGLAGGVLGQLEAHLSEYAWLGTRYGPLESWAIGDLVKRVQAEAAKDVEKELAKELAAEKKHAVALAEAKRLLIRENAHLVDVLQEFLYLRTHRTDVMNKTFFNIQNLLLKLAESEGLSYAELLQCTIDELTGERIPPAEALRERQAGFAFAAFGAQHGVLVGRSLLELKKKMSLLKQGPAGEVKGKTACGGSVRGRCKTVFSKSDYSKVERGDVLITPMTTPEMMVVLEKAVAFVTDEGGITCHAAIISRELGKPCIIGTKVATSVFKDGDLVDVDATNGIVKLVGGA